MKLKEIKNIYEFIKVLENGGVITYNAKQNKTFVLRDSQNKAIGKIPYNFLDMIPYKNMGIDSVSQNNAAMTLESYLYCDINYPLSYGISVADWLFIK